MLMTIVGNRPQLIKMAPISHEIKARGLRELIVHSGQHYDDKMSGVFFRELNIPNPAVTLSVSEKRHGRMTAEMLVQLEDLMLERTPSAVLIYGDTNTTLAAALAAVKLQIPIGHVEAGPRIYDLNTPEEINRLVADHSAQLLFCPDKISLENLRKENKSDNVHFTGDLMYDCYRIFSDRTECRRSNIRGNNLNDLGQFAFMTIHRPANTDKKTCLQNIINFVETSSISILMAIHPRTEAAFQKFGLYEKLQSIPQLFLVGPLSYFETLSAINASCAVITDSGGLQKEAYFARKPAFIMFGETPWPALREIGALDCIGTFDKVDHFDFLDFYGSIQRPRRTTDYFGDGKAAAKIVDLLLDAGWFDAPQTY